MAYNQYHYYYFYYSKEIPIDFYTCNGRVELNSSARNGIGNAATHTSRGSGTIFQALVGVVAHL